MEIPESWKKTAAMISKKGEIVMVLGKTDSGKSTLIAYLLEFCLNRGDRVVVIDTDIGQSSFGPPTCLSLTLWRDRIHPRKPVFPPVLRFVGTTHPARRLLQVVAGAKLLLEKAREKGGDTVLVDTSGLVQGPLGLQLKQHKIELIRPTRLLVLQKGRNLESLMNRLPCIPGMTFGRIPVSPSAKSRSPGERRVYRKGRFSEYFRKSQGFSVTPSFLKKCFFGERTSEGRLVGLLNKSGNTLGLGLIQGNPPDQLKILTPVSSLSDVRLIQSSTVCLNKDWDEVPGPSEPPFQI